VQSFAVIKMWRYGLILSNIYIYSLILSNL
jgi:hypothetical protein